MHGAPCALPLLAAAASGAATPKWDSRSVGDNHLTSPAISGDTVATCVSSGEGTSSTGYAQAAGMDSGAQQWCWPIVGGGLPCGAAVVRGLVTPPVAVGEAVVLAALAQQGPSEAVALDAKNGSVRWAALLCNASGYKECYNTQTYGAQSSTVLSAAGGAVFVPLASQVRALDAASGAELWRWHTGAGDKCAVPEKERQTCGGSTVTKAACEAESLGCCWEDVPQTCPLPVAKRSACGPTGSGNLSTQCTAAGCCWDDDVPCWEFNRCCYGNSQPKCYRQPAQPTVQSSVAVGGGIAYWVTAAAHTGPNTPGGTGYGVNGTLWAADAATGEVKWNATVVLRPATSRPTSVPPSATITADDTGVYVVQTNASGMSITAFGADGAARWHSASLPQSPATCPVPITPCPEAPMQSEAPYSLTVSDGTLFATGLVVSALDAATGKELWRYAQKPPEGLCNVSGKVPKTQCTSSPDGGGKDSCLASGCCWHEEAAKCNVSITDRAACTGGDAATCAAAGCCWDSDVPCWEFNHCCYKSVVQCFSGKSYDQWYYGPSTVADGVLYTEGISMASASGSQPGPRPSPVKPVPPAPPAPGTPGKNATIFALDVKTGKLSAEYVGPFQSGSSPSGAYPGGSSQGGAIPRPAVADGVLVAAFSGGGYDARTHRSNPMQGALEAFPLN